MVLLYAFEEKIIEAIQDIGKLISIISHVENNRSFSSVAVWSQLNCLQAILVTIGKFSYPKLLSTLTIVSSLQRLYLCLSSFLLNWACLIRQTYTPRIIIAFHSKLSYSAMTVFL